MSQQSQSEKAKIFQSLHKTGNPLIIANVWDVGSMKAVIKNGAKAIATASAAISAANGFEDGENVPIDLVYEIARRLVLTSGLPVSVDFESGFADDISILQSNIAKLIEIGVVGCNIEDTNHTKDCQHSVKTASDRIASVKAIINRKMKDFYLNARIDCFLSPNGRDIETLKSETLARAKAYKKAGASGIFVPLLYDWEFIAFLVKTIKLPINIMGGPKEFDMDKAKAAGVARVSFGPYPYRAAMAAFDDFTKPLLA